MSSISIKSILNGSYEKSPDILYEHVLEVSNVSTFETFQNDAQSKTTSIQTLKNDIYTVLLSTGSDRFNNATKLSILDDISSDIETFSTALNNLVIDELSSVISEYNEKLKEAKKITRKKLLEEKVTNINAQNIVVEGPRYYSQTSQLSMFSEYEEYDSSGLYRYYFTAKWNGLSNQETAEIWGDIYRTKYIYIDLKHFTTIEEIEEAIIAVGQKLPYEKNRIVDYE